MPKARGKQKLGKTHDELPLRTPKGRGNQKLGKTHDELPLIAAPAPARPPDGHKAADSEWKWIRSSIPYEKLKDPRKRNGANVSHQFRFYLRAGKHLRDYDPENQDHPKDHPGELIGTNAEFCRRTFCIENGVETYVEGSEVAVQPYYLPDHKSGRVALRVSLGDKYDAKGEKIQALFYLSAVLGWAYNTTFAGKFDEFVAQGWQGDHLVDLESDDLEVFLFIWARAQTAGYIECLRTCLGGFLLCV